MSVFYHGAVTTYFNNLSDSCNCAVDLSKSVTIRSILKKSVTFMCFRVRLTLYRG